MKDYIVIWLGGTGIVQRLGAGGYDVVAFLHCTEAEARLIADDLGVEMRLGSVELDGTDCPLYCEHNLYWK